MSMQVLITGRSSGSDRCSISLRNAPEIFYVKTDNGPPRKIGAKRLLEFVRFVVPIVSPDSEEEPA